MPSRPGWKYEHWDGQAHITPGHRVVTTAIEIQPRPVTSSCRIRALDKEDEQALIAAYFAAFQDSMEYCDWEVEGIAAAARKDIQCFLEGKRGKSLSASRVALAPTEELVGAALIVEREEEPPLLDMLFVIPAWQRKGVATALVSTALNELHRVGMQRLESRYMLGNEASQAWHQRFGFVEKPDLFLAKHY